VSVYEGAYIDKDAIKDSWKMAVRQFVLTVNQFAQEMSIGLIALLLLILKFALYGIILLIVVKFGWKFVRSTWQS
jgi:hypothetical protein